MGPVLGKAIRESRLCRGEYCLGTETIRATVIGAGCHTTQLSGSTVYHQNITFPLKNIPVVEAEADDPAAIQNALKSTDAETAFLSITVDAVPGYGQIKAMAATLAEGFGERPVLVCLQSDFAKALGQCLRLLLPEDRPILCMDGLVLGADSYLDVGHPVGPAIPVVIKTLIFGGTP